MAQRQHQLVLVALFAMLVALKIPSLIEGRFWAEDGLFLVDALQHPWWQALIIPHTGYIDLTASAAMVLATRLTSLDSAALLSVLFAWIIQLCPAILLTTTSCAWLRPRWALIIGLILVLAPPLVEEIWLSPVTSQYHLMVCVALILAFDGGTRWFHYPLLALASLTGPGPALLAPLFGLRALTDRSRQRAIQATILSVGALIEIGIFWSHPEPNRHLVIDLPLLASIIYVKHLILPFAGRWAAIELARHPVPWLAVTALSVVGMAALKARAREVPWLFAAGLIMMVLSYLGALGEKTDLLDPIFGQRYYYAPQVMFGLTLFGLARTGTRVVRHVASALVGWLILIGGWEYFIIHPTMAYGPSWRAQLHERVDRRISLWPATVQIILPR